MLKRNLSACRWLAIAIFFACSLQGILNAADEVFDAEYDDRFRVTISESCVEIDLPPLGDIEQTFQFCNGLYGISRCGLYEDPLRQQQHANDRNYAGNVNILPKGKTFVLVFEHPLAEQQYRYYSSRCMPIVELILDFSEGLPKYYRILSITENLDPTELPEQQRQYIIKLNDGSAWMTLQDLASAVDPIWEEGTRVIKIGNSEHPCLINFDAIWRDVEPRHCLTDLRPVVNALINDKNFGE